MPFLLNYHFHINSLWQISWHNSNTFDFSLILLGGGEVKVIKIIHAGGDGGHGGGGHGGGGHGGGGHGGGHGGGYGGGGHGGGKMILALEEET